MKTSIFNNSVIFQAIELGFDFEDFTEETTIEEDTFDVYFNDSENSNNKGFEADYDYCKDYIDNYNGTDESYFEDYKGGTVSIVNNKTGETVYEEEIR